MSRVCWIGTVKFQNGHSFQDQVWGHSIVVLGEDIVPSNVRRDFEGTSLNQGAVGPLGCDVHNEYEANIP